MDNKQKSSAYAIAKVLGYEKSFEELEKYWINEIKTSCPKYSSKININM